VHVNRFFANVTVMACFMLAALGAVGFVVTYWWTDDQAMEGAFFGSGLVFLAIGLVLWSHHLVPQGPFEEEYPDLVSEPAQHAEVLARMDRGDVGRRKVLLGTMGVAGGAVTAAVASSFRSLGPDPSSLAHTPWRGGRKAVLQDGTPVNAHQMPENSFLVVFPEGFTSQPDAQAILIHLPPGKNHPLPGRRSWAPDNLVCYSRVCSHAGCPVTMYNALAFQLHCPCHQSTFDVLRGAKPVFGPAGGPLSQLPIAVDADGSVRSTGDFDHPPGPVFWHYQASGPQ
jgi:ubiquinol-cytochrome c reductase iron-sulfur subunit